ncbi:MAG TPA: metallopeptidase TldD-related protein [Candidatus Acidoferrum sp.]|nr:metallopeptidase TldD-related protein [Candidatus Acidoferrum sp.]
MKKWIVIAVLASLSVSAPLYARAHRAAPPAQQQPPDNDQTIHAMHDEMQRSMARLRLPGVDKPYFIEYRLLDLNIREITATFGGLVSSTTTNNRLMSVDVRVGDYHLDSSNFISEDGFQGFLGSTGQVGIDHDYNSLRQDLWLATDQAYKSAATQMSLKQAFLRSLTKPPEIDDFSQEPAVVKVDPRVLPDWTSRNWEEEARQASAALKDYPQLYGTRVNYYIIYTTYYLMNSEGTTLRVSHSIAGIEAAMDTQADDGMPLHNSYAVYVPSPSDLPDPSVVAKGLTDAAEQLTQLRNAPLLSDYTGPVLFDAPAAGSLLAQVLPASLSGARPPLSMMPAFDELLQRMGGASDWSGRIGTRVLPTSVSLYDDPSATEFEGHPLLGAYEVDDEGVKGERVSIVENGLLKDLLLSRRPGPDFSTSNGHARSALLSDTKPLSSNLFLAASDALDSAALHQKFIESCKEDGQSWCLEIKRMDNPALTSLNQQDFSDFLGSLAGGISSGERIPLLVYRVYVSDGHEELVRGGHIEGLTLRNLHNMLAEGSDSSVYTFMQNPAGGFAGTSLGAFGSIQGGIPSTIVTPSLLLDEVEVRGFHGEPRRLPIVSAPPLQ